MSESLDLVTKQFLHSFQSSAASLAEAGMSLAYWLAFISICISLVIMIVQGEGLGKSFSKLLQTGLLFGMFFGLIHLSGEWIPIIINSFMQVGGHAADLESLSPNSVFEVGTNIAGKLFSLVHELGITGLPTALLAIVCGCFVLIIYCFICAELVVNMIKAYALITVAPIIFAFGNNDFTRSAVTNYMRKVIGMGLQIMMLYLIIGVGVKMGDQWINAFRDIDSFRKFGVQGLMPVAGGLIVLYLVLKNVPAFIAEIAGAGGFRNYGEAAVAAAMNGAMMMGQALQKSMAVGRGTATGLGHAKTGIDRAGAATAEAGKKVWRDSQPTREAFVKSMKDFYAKIKNRGGDPEKAAFDVAKENLNSAGGKIMGKPVNRE